MLQVCQAIGDIVRQTEKTPNDYTYVEFLFGVLDYAGLKYIDTFHITHIFSYNDVKVKKNTGFPALIRKMS